MFIDFKLAESPKEYDCDICIIGTGPAGISIAREFIGSNTTICLVESGNYAADSDTQALYKGETHGLPHTALDTCRLRFLGGSSNCWNGWCAPFDDYDFTAKPWVPHSNWPIDNQDLSPYYTRSGIACEVGPHDFSDRYWKLLDLEKPAFDESRIRVCNWRISPPTRFGRRYHSELEQANNITVLLNANAVDLETTETANQVSAVALASINGRRGTVRAKQYVLACGGIENPRLLLASNNNQGLANDHDQVGRYFMEHPYATSALAFSLPANFHLDVKKILDGVSIYTGFATTAALQEKEQIMASMMVVHPQDDIDPLFSWGRRPLPATPPGYQRYSLLSQSEQSPDPENRISLSSTLDRFGKPLARMDWRLNELDKRTISVQVRALGTEFARLGLGRIKYADWLLDKEAYWGVEAGNHHMGTTRMGDDPKTSVVDKHCQVHGISNLHIAGSSVFVTSSWVNPTFTLVALALRLADRLKDRLA